MQITDSDFTRPKDEYSSYFGRPYTVLVVSDDQTTANMDPCASGMHYLCRYNAKGNLFRMRSFMFFIAVITFTLKVKIAFTIICFNILLNIHLAENSFRITGNLSLESCC